MCADKHYRKALAHDKPKKERLEACIKMKTDSLKAYALALGLATVVEVPAVAEVAEEEFIEVQQEVAQQQQVQQQQMALLERLQRRLQEADAREEERKRQDAEFLRGVKKISEYGKDGN
jgi:hypothetical protein